MARLIQAVYNGKAADDLTKDELIREILIDSGISDGYTDGKIRRAMEEAFRQGWLRGEDYQCKISNCVKESDERTSCRFIDYLKSAVELDCDLIIGDVDMPASFVWYNDGDTVITEAGYQKFKSIMDAPYEILDNGNIEIFCDDDELGEKFVYAAAGYIGDSDYKLYFEGEWYK